MLIQCTICMSSITPSDSANSTACGHIFHTPCLDQWLLRSATCPQCRTRCNEHNIRRLFFSTSMNTSTSETSETLQIQVDDAKLELRNLKVEIAKRETQIHQLRNTQKQCKEIINNLESIRQLDVNKLAVANIEITFLKKELKRLCVLEKDLKEKTEQLEKMDQIRSVINSTANEVDAILKEGRSSSSLATMVVMFKRQLTLSDKKITDIRTSLKNCQEENKKLKSSNRELQDTLSTLESDNHKLTNDLSQLHNAFNQPKSSENRVGRGLITFEDDQGQSEFNTTQSELISASSTSSSAAVRTNLPYLHIKQSNVGLSPLLKRKLITQKSEVDGPKEGLYKNLSIFNNPRKILKTVSTARNPSFVYNGTGGTERKENFIGFPQVKSKNNTSDNGVASYAFHSFNVKN